MFYANNEGGGITSHALEHQGKKYKAEHGLFLSHGCSKTVLNHILYKNDLEIHLISYLIRNKTNSVCAMKSANTLGSLNG